MYPTTPDGRYFVVKGQLWRCSNPALDDEERQLLVNTLMTARRAVKAAKASGDPAALKAARADVQTAKVALGERGPVWWDDGAPDLNQHKVANTPYAAWHSSLSETKNQDASGLFGLIGIQSPEGRPGPLNPDGSSKDKR